MQINIIDPRDRLFAVRARALISEATVSIGVSYGRQIERSRRGGPTRNVSHPDQVRFPRGVGLSVGDAIACRASTTRYWARAELFRFLDRDPIGKSRRLRIVLYSGLFERFDKPGQNAGRFLGNTQHP